MTNPGEISFSLEDGTDVFIDAQADGVFHIRYVMPNGLPNVVLWSKEGKNESFFDPNALEAINKLAAYL
jgi:hypothetical protein